MNIFVKKQYNSQYLEQDHPKYQLYSEDWAPEN